MDASAVGRQFAAHSCVAVRGGRTAREVAADGARVCAAGIPVSGGGGDNMMAAIGAGAVIEGPVVVSLGNLGHGVRVPIATGVDPVGEASAFCDSTGGWLPLCTLNCTQVTDWIARLFGLDHSGAGRGTCGVASGCAGSDVSPHLGR